MPPPAEQRPPRPLAPSSIGDDEVTDAPPTPQQRAAAERGRLIHALIERLPATDQAARAAAAEAWLVRRGMDDAAERRATIEAVMRVMEDPRLAALFGEEALAEAPITAVVGGTVVSGTVDRLLVTDDHVLVADFKTARRPPGRIADVPVYHLRQMAAYVAALQVIFPDRPVDAVLVYTAGPVVLPLPSDLIDAHKPRLTATEQS